MLDQENYANFWVSLTPLRNLAKGWIWSITFEAVRSSILFALALNDAFDLTGDYAYYICIDHANPQRELFVDFVKENPNCILIERGKQYE